MSPNNLSPKNLTFTATGPLLLALGLTAAGAAAEEIVTTQGIAVEVRQVIEPGPQGRGGPAIGEDVQDFSDGTTNEGGVPQVTVDPRDAAIQGEKNLGPNAPGYIP